MVSSRSTSLFLAACVVALSGLALTATEVSAQSAAPVSYPTRPIRIVVPFAPGGTTDIMARALSEPLRSRLGQAVVVESKPGADGSIAIQELIRSGGDGHTLLIGNVATNAIAPILSAGKLSFDYERDVVPVMRLVDVPGVLVGTTRNFPPRSLSELVAYIKAHPGEVNYGTPGFGSYVHYDMVTFGNRAGLVMTAIPNKAGASGLINDLLVGTVQVSFVNAASSAGSIKAGTLRAYAVANHVRLPDLPNVPTMAEAGFPGVGTIAWQGLFASAATPRPVLEKVREAVMQALDEPAVKRILEQQSFNIVPTHSLDEAKAWLASDMKDWRKTIGETKLEAK